MVLSSGPEFDPCSRQNLLTRKRGSIANNLSLSTSHRPDMTEIPLKRTSNRKSSIHSMVLCFSRRQTLCIFSLIIMKIQSNLSKGVTQGKGKKWLKTGDPLIQAHLHFILAQGIQKGWLLRTGDPLIEVTT